MKKLLSIALAGSVASTAMAQEASQSIVRLPGERSLEVRATPAPNGRVYKDLAQRVAARRAEVATANKTTLSGSRVYNWVDALFGINPAIADNQSFAYTWPNYRGLAIFAGNTYDTINLASTGMVIHPWYSFWNSLDLFDPTELGLKNTSAYTVDSVMVYGTYARQTARPNVVDSVRIAVFYGNGGTSNLGLYYDVGNTSDFGVDTIRFALPDYDTVRATAKGDVPAAIVYRTIPLTAASENDTNAFGLNVIRAAVNLSVPAGNLVGMTATFVPGENFATGPNGYDTVLKDAGNGTVSPKYSMFRPRHFEQNDGAYPNYYANSYNHGLFKLLPLTGNPVTSYRYLYMPNYFYTAPSSAEFLDVDFKISSNAFETLLTLGLASVSTNVTSDRAYPNPANNEVRVALTLSTASEVSVSLSNAVGQVIDTKVLGKVPATIPQEVSFSTAQLAPGVYFYTVNAGGASKTGRILVAR